MRPWILDKETMDNFPMGAGKSLTQAALDDINIKAAFVDGLPNSFKPIRFSPPEEAILLDTETTGLDPFTGDRLVSIGAAIMRENVFVSGREWIVNPGRPIPNEATLVHGISNQDVLGKPAFHDVADEFMAYIGHRPLIIFNSSFDLKFLQYELKQGGMPLLRNPILDVLPIVRASQKANKQSSLDVVMAKFGVTWLDRAHHGALKDAIAMGCVYRGFAIAAQNMPPMPNPLPADRTPRPIRSELYEPVAAKTLPEPG